MFIVLMDEPTLFVFDSAEQAAAEIELRDAHCEVRAAFDEEGLPYKPDRELRETRWTVEVEPYRWVPAGESNVMELLALIERQRAPIDAIDPNSATVRLERLAAALRART